MNQSGLYVEYIADGKSVIYVEFNLFGATEVRVVPVKSCCEIVVEIVQSGVFADLVASSVAVVMFGIAVLQILTVVRRPGQRTRDVPREAACYDAANKRRPPHHHHHLSSQTHTTPTTALVSDVPLTDDVKTNRSLFIRFIA